jgi:hypothetical protein
VTTPESFDEVTPSGETSEPLRTPEPIEAFTGVEPPVGLPEALGADVGESPPDLLDETRID